MIFNEIIGNEAVKAKLKHALEKETVSNTFLFSGPEGVGKSLFAKEFAGFIMHPEKDIDPEALKKIKSNNHPDLHIYEPEGKTSHHTIASMRDLIEQVFFAPFEATSKVFIINDADRLPVASANALLKTLEEPTLDSYIILISSKPENVLSTILSRCFKVKFLKIEEDKIVSYLQNNYQKSLEDAKKIAKISSGSIGKAIEIAKDPGYIEKTDLLLKILSKEDISSYVELTDALSKLEDIYLKSFSDVSSNKLYQEIDLLYEKISFWFRDLYLLKNNINEEFLFFSDKKEFLEKQVSDNLPPLDKILTYIEDIKFAISRNIKLKYALEHFFLKINFV
ncbi:MAG: DNA polymerase III subunit delta' [Parachlamydiales bacterium]|nr:DNA polymerase III subunit delta' [Parachlamydiales bacterium]